MTTTKLLRIFVTVTLLATLASSTPRWLLPELPPSARISTDPKALEDYLLPTDIFPVAYDIHLVPFLETPLEKSFTFDGIVNIEVIAMKPTKVIKMHAYDINITTIEIMDVNGNSVPVKGHDISTDDKQFLTINIDNTLELGGKYTIKITYVGKLNDDLDGFYRSKYEEDGVTKWLAVTQFESTGARRAFPCWDEPSWKARFTLHIAHSSQHTALSNMPADGDDVPYEDDPALTDWWWTHFQQSVVMSSYLVAFTVSEFTNFPHPTDTRFKDWARPSLVQFAEYSNQMAPRAIKHMETYTGHLYTLPKMDQIAVPDFAAGAMENWGLVTYRESAMLYEEGVSTTSNKMGVASIVAHELAHQWFGDLVSPKWWSSIWLNEGFATYFSYDILVGEFPEWQQREAFVQGDLQYAFQVDGLESSHPLLVNADSPASTSAVFDTIAYSKGGSIVYMMVNLLGEDNFKLGINAYLEDMKFKTADKDDLWRNLQTAVPQNVLPEGVDLKAVMDTWTVQAGYPVVTVTRDYAGATAKVTQERFLTLRTGPSTEVWWVPLTMTSQAAPDFNDLVVKGWHSGPEIKLTDLPATNKQWLLCNIKQVGYYRVNYDATNWGLLAAALNDHSEMSKIHVVNRGQLVDDALALARAGLLDYQLALDTTEYLGHEEELYPWSSALSALTYMYDRLAYDKVSREAFEWYVLDKLAPLYETLGGFEVGEEDSDITKIKRAMVLRWACKMGEKECNEQAAVLFKEWQDTPTVNNIDPDLKSVVYCAGMREGGQVEYDFLFAQYEASATNAAEQSLLLSAMGCASDPTILQNYLDKSIEDNSAIRKQDARSVLSAVYSNYLGVDIALDFLLTNYEKCSEVYGGLGAMGRVFSGISAKLNTQEHRDKLTEFRESNLESLGSVLPSVDGAIKTVDETLVWHEQYRETVVFYFREKRGDFNAAPLAALSPVLMAVLVLAASLS